MQNHDPFRFLMDHHHILTIIMLSVMAIYALYFLWRHHKNLQLVNAYISRHYVDLGLEVLSVSKLKMADRIRYSVPFSPFLSFFQKQPSFITNNRDLSIFRLIETIDTKGIEHLRYVEIKLFRSGEFDLQEFDVYEF